MLRMILAIALLPQLKVALPDPTMTPGAIRTTDASEICAPTFRTKPYRLTTPAMKHAVCAEYKVSPCPHAQVLEIDHLVPLELGGLDDVRNLWTQMAEPRPGFHEKDKLENELRKRVCVTHQISLPDAQHCLQLDWYLCYKQVFGK